MTHKLIYEINDIDKKALPTWLLVVGVIFAVIIIGVIVFFVMKEKGMI